MFYDTALYQVYELIGSQNGALLREVRAAFPGARGPSLAAATLEVLGAAEADRALREGRAFFERWVTAQGGRMPGFSWSERHEVEKEDLRWFGLALIIALAGGVLLSLARGRRPYEKHGTTSPASSKQPRPKKLRFAVGAFSGKVRDVGVDAAGAGDLFTQAPFWWVGSTDGWDDFAQSATLSLLAELPSADDVLVVLAYELAQGEGGEPSSRTEGAARLRDALQRNALTVVGTFAVDEPAKLSDAGFRR